MSFMKLNLPLNIQRVRLNVLTRGRPPVVLDGQFLKRRDGPNSSAHVMCRRLTCILLVCMLSYVYLNLEQVPNT